MTWLETQGIRLVLGRLRARLGGAGMARVGSVTILLGGIIAILSGVESLLSHFTAGDLFQQACTSAEAAAWSGQCPSNLIKCLGQIGAGMAIFSPGVSAFKSGVFARPTQVVVPQIPPPSGPPAA